MIKSSSLWFVCAVGVLVTVQTLGALQDDKRSTATGAFTSEQATRGERAFISECGGCHTPDQFVGEFLMAWNGKTASETEAADSESKPTKPAKKRARSEAPATNPESGETQGEPKS